MIDRYTRAEMESVWSASRRFQLMLEVEGAFLRALSRRKAVPAAQLRVFEGVLRLPLAEEVARREKDSGHEVVALLQAVSDKVKTKAPAVHRYLHYGLTSSDILDTVLALQLMESADLILGGWRKVSGLIASLARRHGRTWMAGRTHGVHAEPMTFGAKLSGWRAEAERNIDRVERARELISRGKLSGAVGTYAHISPALESEVLSGMGLRAETAATQVVPRDRHADYFHALVLSAAAIERFATEIRHLQRTEVLEAEEPFGEGQKGSSAMPHKRNPVLCENLCGLARLIRSYEAAVVENIVLWHERDISHSSVERVILPDALILLDFMLHRFAGVVSGLQVYPERMKENLARSMGLVFSQKVLLALIDKGVPRMRAYEWVQRNAMKTWKLRRDFLETLREDREILKIMTPRELAACFELASYAPGNTGLLRRSTRD